MRPALYHPATALVNHQVALLNTPFCPSSGTGISLDCTSAISGWNRAILFLVLLCWILHLRNDFPHGNRPRPKGKEAHRNFEIPCPTSPESLHRAFPGIAGHRFSFQEPSIECSWICSSSTWHRILYDRIDSRTDSTSPPGTTWRCQQRTRATASGRPVSAPYYWKAK